MTIYLKKHIVSCFNGRGKFGVIFAPLFRVFQMSELIKNETSCLCGSYNMPVGLLPNVADLTMTMQYFSDQRPDYYCFSNQTQEMTETDIKAYFASEV